MYVCMRYCSAVARNFIFGAGNLGDTEFTVSYLACGSKAW